MGKREIELLDAIDEAEVRDSGQNAAREAFHVHCVEDEKKTSARLDAIHRGDGEAFTDMELSYAERARCGCGAGLAYPDGIGMRGAWYCSRLLRGEVEASIEHLPFMFYEIRSESQPGASTTRPEGTHVEKEPHYACKGCGHVGSFARYRPADERSSMQKEWKCSECGAGYLADGQSYLGDKLKVRFHTIVVADDDPAAVPEKASVLAGGV